MASVRLSFSINFVTTLLSYHKASIAANTEVITIGHNDIETLERLCKTHDTVAYVADGVYSMGGSAPIDDLLRLQDKYGLFLYIDDAHGISIQKIVAKAMHTRSRLGASLRERTIVAASLSKGFGTNGGVLMLATDKQDRLIRRYAVPHTFSMGPDVGFR